MIFSPAFLLFANDPQASEAAIKANPEIAKKDLDRLNRCFFVPESVELDAALKIVKKARLGDVDYVFKRKNLDRLFEPVSFNRGKIHLIQNFYIPFIILNIRFCSRRELRPDGCTIRLYARENSVR
jgi:hypothetical protein